MNILKALVVWGVHTPQSFPSLYAQPHKRFRVSLRTEETTKRRLGQVNTGSKHVNNARVLTADVLTRSWSARWVRLVVWSPEQRAERAGGQT